MILLLLVWWCWCSSFRWLWCWGGEARDCWYRCAEKSKDAHYIDKTRCLWWWLLNECVRLLYSNLSAAQLLFSSCPPLVHSVMYVSEKMPNRSSFSRARAKMMLGAWRYSFHKSRCLFSTAWRNDDQQLLSSSDIEQLSIDATIHNTLLPIVLAARALELELLRQHFGDKKFGSALLSSLAIIHKKVINSNVSRWCVESLSSNDKNLNEI